MNIHYTLDDSAARLPLSIRSSEAVWDRAADLRSSPGVQLVELTTQHLLPTGLALVDELADYFEAGAPSDSDPYGLGPCFEQRAMLEDLLRDVRETQPDLVALHEVAELFPLDFTHDLQFMLALTVIGYPAFGYVRTYKDSEGEEYHGLVVNLAQARPHVEGLLGHFSLERLVNLIRHGFFNHEGFLLAYSAYCDAIGRTPERPAERAKDRLMRRGIAWYLSYRHDLAFYDQALGLESAELPGYVTRYNAHLASVEKKRGDDALAQTLDVPEPDQPWGDIVGYFAARAIAGAHGDEGLRESVAQGAAHFLRLYHALSLPALTFGG
ncbi:MAG: hypothetical protein M5U29_14605 [Anaerolineae bacterium]|nr:hypothetical protein [Anaerolineae bacterium]